MNAMFGCKVERRDFGDLLSPDGIARRRPVPMSGIDEVLSLPLNGQELIAAWSRDPLNTGLLPELLVCDDGTETDWAAWITTYASRIRPFSANSRLLGLSDARKLASARQPPELRRLTWPAVGVVLGEVLTASRLSDRELESVPAMLCLSTLSFALFRAAAIYHPCPYEISNITDRWSFAQDMARRQVQPHDALAIGQVCGAIIEAGLSSSAVSLRKGEGGDAITVCRELLDFPGEFPPSLRSISGFASIEGAMHGPREDRVVVLEKIFRDIAATSRPTDRDFVALALGYLTSRLAPGTLRHSSMLRGLIDKYPTALLWYGFCAGLSGKPGPADNESGAARWAIDFPMIGRRIVREFLRMEEFLSLPTSDIGIRELHALSRTGRELPLGLIRTAQGAMTVELFPGVLTAVGNAFSRASATELRFDESSARMIDRELKGIADRIERLRRDFGYAARGVREPEIDEPQAQLFGPKKRKR